ncbi:MAG: hypothetical protein AAB834_05600, partial [Patescibacteria group bacterium]
MKEEINLKSLRARKARLSRSIGKGGQSILYISLAALLAVGIYCLTLEDLVRIGYFALAGATLSAVLVLWYRYDLKDTPPKLPPTQLDDIIQPGLLALLKHPVTPQTAWEAACRNPEALFITNHLLLDWKSLTSGLSNNEQDMALVWRQALALTDTAKGSELHSGVLASAILITSPVAEAFLTRSKLRKEEVGEVLSWIDRQLKYFQQPKPYFGGIGRDWASGFTPTLEHFGQDISQGVERNGGGAHYLSHADLLDGIASSLSRGNGVALVGADGTGKTTLVYGLAQRLLEGRHPELQYYR